MLDEAGGAVSVQVQCWDVEKHSLILANHVFRRSYVHRDIIIFLMLYVRYIYTAYPSEAGEAEDDPS